MAEQFMEAKDSWKKKKNDPAEAWSYLMLINAYIHPDGAIVPVSKMFEAI